MPATEPSTFFEQETHLSNPCDAHRHDLISAVPLMSAVPPLPESSLAQTAMSQPRLPRFLPSTKRRADGETKWSLLPRDPAVHFLAGGGERKRRAPSLWRSRGVFDSPLRALVLCLFSLLISLPASLAMAAMPAPLAEEGREAGEDAELLLDLLDLPKAEPDAEAAEEVRASEQARSPEQSESEASTASRRVHVAGEGQKEEESRTAEEVFDFRMQGIGAEVDELKEQVARTKARLQILADTILGGSGVRSGAKLIIRHRNRLGASYRLIGIQYFLDGAPAFLQADESGALQATKELKIFEQRLVPGEHQLVVRYTLRGSGHGLLSYLDNYTIELTASHNFSVEAGTVTTVDVGLRERRSLVLRFEERPDVAFETHVETDLYRHRPEQEQSRAEGVRQ